MLWYPAQAVRRLPPEAPVPRGPARGGDSNGGVFVRFPDPEADPRVRRVLEGRRRRDDSPSGSRSTAATRSSSTTARAARPARRARSTRSTTTTSTTIGAAEAGEWEDYEIEVVGQHYKISRNGDVINEWDNRPGLNSDRGGRPEHDAASVHARLHRPAEPRRRGHDAVPQHPRRGPDAGRAEGQRRDGGVRRSPATARTRSRSARRTRPATRRTRVVRRSTIGEPGGAGPARRRSRSPLAPTSSILPPLIDTPASFRLGSDDARASRARRSTAAASRCRCPARARWTARRR